MGRYPSSRPLVTTAENQAKVSKVSALALMH